jgi:hypothetical protein
MLSKIAAWQAAGNPGADELRARGNQDPYLQAVGLLDAARVFAGAGSLRDARRLIPDAERQSRNVKTVHYRLGLWIDLAEVSRAIGETSDAERLAGEVAELLPEVLAAPSRALIMAKLAGVFARLGRPANATEWSHQSENLVLSLSRPSSQAHVLRELAVSVSHWDPGRGHCLLAQALAVGPWPVSLPGLVALDPAALCEVVDSGFQFVPPLHTGMR